MITLIYHKSGRAVADADAEKFVRNLKDGTVIMVSTENVILAAKTLRTEMDIDVEFVFEGKTLSVNKYGALLDWPKGFCNYALNWSTRTITNAMEIKKKERAEE